MREPRVRVRSEQAELETSSIIPELEKTSCRDTVEPGIERHVCACKLSPVFVVVDRFASGTYIGYYLGRKSK